MAGARVTTDDGGATAVADVARVGRLLASGEVAVIFPRANDDVKRLSRFLEVGRLRREVRRGFTF